MTGLRQAFAFLTILPMGPVGAPGTGALAWFPVVGLALGAALVGVDAIASLALPAIVVGALLLAASLLLSGALHAEGVLDCCDGLFGGYTPGDRLRILSDTHVGAFAVIGGATLLIVKWSALAGLPDGSRIGLLLLFPCLSRFGMLLAVHAFPYVRTGGLGSSLKGDSTWRQLAIGALIAAGAAGLEMGYGGLILWGAVMVVASAAGRWMSGRLGGLTGDAYGAINHLCEVAALILGIALAVTWPTLLDGPI